MFLLSGISFLPMSKLDKFNSAKWVPRSFAWVDPMKDVQAKLLLIDNNLMSPQEVALELGMNLEDVYTLIQKSQELKDKYNIKDSESQPTQETTDNE